MHGKLETIGYLLACKIYDAAFSKGLIYLQEYLVTATPLCPFTCTQWNYVHVKGPLSLSPLFQNIF